MRTKTTGGHQPLEREAADELTGSGFSRKRIRLVRRRVVSQRRRRRQRLLRFLPSTLPGNVVVEYATVCGIVCVDECVCPLLRCLLGVCAVNHPQWLKRGCAENPDDPPVGRSLARSFCRSAGRPGKRVEENDGRRLASQPDLPGYRAGWQNKQQYSGRLDRYEPRKDELRSAQQTLQKRARSELMILATPRRLSYSGQRGRIPPSLAPERPV